jgi:hypothetical protein
MPAFRRRCVRTTMLVCLLLATPVARAMETDQFTAPRAALYDIGPALSLRIAEIIESDRTGADPEDVLSRWAGSNIFVSRLGRWVKQLRAEQESRFAPSVFASVYRWAFSPVPFSFLLSSPTVHVHGFYMGTDKIDHFVQQGHEYYEIVMREQAQGADLTVATARAVARGVSQEHTYYGTAVSGVYSNADLAANYAGLKFYLNLRQPVRIDGRVRPPLLVKTAQGWRVRPDIARTQLLRPFLSDHLDESLNPSRYRFSRGLIRSHVRDRCETWKRFYADRLTLVAPSGRSFATTWFGEEYGHWLPPEDEASIATECAPGLLLP